MKAVGALISLIGIGTVIAGYLYPNTGKELTNAVEEYEKNKFWGEIIKNYSTLLRN